jgi:DNA-directed RNA polymerase subunit RPC12/RpoP
MRDEVLFGDGSCTWTEDSDGSWDTECGDKFVFLDSGPMDNGFYYCPYCGNGIIIKRASSQ